MSKIFFPAVLLISLIACAGTSGTGGYKVNPADRHVWVPADEEDLEQRRLRQAELDSIARDVEKLFLKFETIGPGEQELRDSTVAFIPEIQDMESQFTGQISDEQKRREAMGRELAAIRSSKERVETQVAKLTEVKPVPVFSRKDYLRAFRFFRKGNYEKSVLLFKKNLNHRPPHSLIDNILFGLSVSYFKLKKYPEAIKPLTRVIQEFRRSDKWFLSHIMLGLTHDKNAEKSQALYILDQALKENPPGSVRTLIDRLKNLIQDEVIPITS
ncbi:MAG: hypothetical protein IID18_08325 [Nitrospinae bacterium]|nr:hypothetical protein [Nitrospinota bacterium]